MQTKFQGALQPLATVPLSGLPDAPKNLRAWVHESPQPGLLLCPGSRRATKEQRASIGWCTVSFGEFAWSGPPVGADTPILSDSLKSDTELRVNSGLDRICHWASSLFPCSPSTGSGLSVFWQFFHQIVYIDRTPQKIFAGAHSSRVALLWCNRLCYLKDVSKSKWKYVKFWHTKANILF